MLEIVPRARRAAGFLQFPKDLRHGLDVIGDLTDTEVVGAVAGRVQVRAERATQFPEPVVVAANLDQGSMPVLDLVENAHKRDLELSQVYGERPRLHLHGGIIVALVHAAGRMPRFAQDISAACSLPRAIDLHNHDIHLHNDPVNTLAGSTIYVSGVVPVVYDRGN